MEKRVLFIDEADVRFYNACLNDCLSECTNVTLSKKWCVPPLCADATSPILTLSIKPNAQNHLEAKLNAYRNDKSRACIGSLSLRHLDGTFWMQLPDGSEVGLDIIPISAERVLSALKGLIEDVRDTWSSGYGDVMAASSLSFDELKALGYNDVSDEYDT